MTVAVDSYSISSKYYDDAYAKKQDLVDLPFYLNLARQIGGPVLELACGTGRILLRIAREGIAVDGVDNSAPMLEILRKNLSGEPKEVCERVAIFAADMRTFRSTRKYPLVIIPFRPMQHMYTVEDQVGALITAAHHLDYRGMLAFDVFYPKYERIFSGIGEELLELEWPLQSCPGKLVRRYFRKDAVDKIQQTMDLTFIFRTYEGEKVTAEESESLKMCWYTYQQLRALFLLANLEVVEEYGSFAKTALDNTAEQMIFLLRTAKSS